MCVQGASAQSGGPEWTVQTYNSIPGCYAPELQQHAIDAMAAFEQFSQSIVKVIYNRAEPAVMPCPVQDNAVDCGMCVLGFTLSLALQPLSQHCVV